MTIRRMKTYDGAQGFVYQYYFVGKRPALGGAPDGPGTEYIFDVSSDRKATFAVSILLPDATLRNWATSHGRGLSEAEQYAAVKMRLFRGFDEVENMRAAGRQLSLSDESLDQLLGTLGVK